MFWQAKTMLQGPIARRFEGEETQFQGRGVVRPRTPMTCDDVHVALLQICQDYATVLA